MALKKKKTVCKTFVISYDFPHLHRTKKTRPWRKQSFISNSASPLLSSSCHVTGIDSCLSIPWKRTIRSLAFPPPPPDQTVGVTRRGGGCYVLQSGLTGRWRQEMCLPFFSFPSYAQYKTRNATALPRKKKLGRPFHFSGKPSYVHEIYSMN